MIFVHDTPTNRLLNMVLGGGSPVAEYTATGNPLTFFTDLSRPLKSLLIPFFPKQEGTGDPSPSNIRPIVPWEGLTVCGAGGNLIDASQLQDGYVWWNGNKIGGYAPNCVSPLIPVKAGSTYYRQGRTASQNAVSFFDKDKAFLSQSVIQPPTSFTVPNGACYAGFTFGKDYKDEAMVNAGSSAMPYEEYKPITETDIVFPSPVYGGTLDVVSGVLTVEWAGFSATWGDGESATDMGSGITRKIFPMVDYLTTGSANNICNIAPYQANENAFTHFYYSGSGATNRKCRLFLPSDTPTTTVVTVITKLSQTYEIQLTPEQITALVGNNTIWSDADGSMTAIYLKKG